MAKNIEERLKKLEEATGVSTPKFIYIGQAPDGKPQYLDCMTGKFLPELPSDCTVVGRTQMDLTTI